MRLASFRATTSLASSLRRVSSDSIYNGCRCRRYPSITSRRPFNVSAKLQAAIQDAKVDLKHVRNIGIIAHIDAGKTTTTERMLFYSGTTNRIGDVDEGSTVMDYLPEEKQRGITITSAAITLEWPPSPHHATTPDILSQPTHTINLIDTPGHADFTFEVERSIRVLDGAVTILDGVAGVEAQTETVWRQADRYRIPRIIYINKLDRIGAVPGRVVKDIAARLNVWPALTQLPLNLPVKREGGGVEDVFSGVVDLLHMNLITWNPASEGREITLSPVSDWSIKHPNLHAESLRARTALVELLAEHDEEILTKFIDTESESSITAADLKRALRYCTLTPSTRIIPVLLGASRANQGVQPVLDAVLDYLPSPFECSKSLIPITLRGERALLPLSETSKLCALVFKVMHDPRRGMLSYVRVYSGTLRQGDQLFNTTLQHRERALKLLKMYANEATEIDSIRTGHIGVIVNYKSSRTGDTLINADSVTNLSSTGPSDITKHHKREKKFKKKHSKHAKEPEKVDPLTDASLHLQPISIPPPVFFASLEPNSHADEKGLRESLNILEREDPSLHISTDDESGQMILSGMGELHLQISRNRLVNDLKAKCSMGQIKIGYREVVSGSTVHREVYDREILGKRSYAGVTASVSAIREDGTDEETTGILARSTINGNEVVIAIAGVNSSAVAPEEEPEDITSYLPSYLDPDTLIDNLINGAIAALSRGPLNFELHSTRVVLTLTPGQDFASADESPPSAFLVAARMATEKAIGECGTGLMEPFMNVVISCDEGDVGSVVGDITSGAGGGSVLSLDDEGGWAADGSSGGGGGGNGGGSGLYDTGGESTSTTEGGEFDGYMERELIDVGKVYAPPLSYGSSGAGGDGFADEEGGHARPKLVRARVPLAKMMGYVKHLKSMTKGRGSFVMSMDRFERMSDQRARGVMGSLRL